MPHDFSKGVKDSATKVSASEDTRLPGKPKPKFVYAHFPSSWEFSEDHGFIPRLKKIPLRPGINGHTKGPRGHIPVLNRLVAEGWVVIADTGPIKVSDENGEIVDDFGYLVRYDGVRGPTYADAWALPVVLGAGPNATVDWTSQYDAAGFEAWRVFLRDENHVPAITPSAMSAMIERQNRRASRRIGEAHDGAPHVQAKVEAEQRKLNAMREAALKLGARVKGKTKKRGPGRPKGKRAHVTT